ncbi:PREDICTED: odorant receptor 49b-like [Ceratosolen solmsi marchali]|uniref:Odorant receptor n=1 Tax=Ceratosolen solmsi marchali TaxID=326594 RepID=A0AAJ6VJU5_9HYME|nr:PREDICTED: odorant receptor 49b-like [Ceratosolen solmsi marchali]
MTLYLRCGTVAKRILNMKRLFKFCKDISKITESFFMVQLLSSTYNLSILLYAIITDNQNNFQLLPVVGLQTLQLFSCHWISEILRSEKILVTRDSSTSLNLHRNSTHWIKKKNSEVDLHMENKYMRFMKTLTRIYLISYILALLMYVATNIMLASSISINGIPHKHLMFGKTVYVRKPFFEIISVLEILSAGVMTTSSGYDMAAPFIITMAAGYFKTLFYRYENAQKQHSFNNDDQMFKDIIACIIYHQKIDRFCTNINKFTKSLFLIQLISSTYNLSILLLVVILNPKEDLKNGPIIIVQALQFFLCHWTSDVLLSESLDIRKSVYMIPSVNRKDTKLSKLIQILLMKLQNPVQLTAGGFINLSVECFGNMMSSVVSFFLVIHSFTNH